MIRRRRLCTVSLLFLHPHLDFLLSAPPPFEVALKTRGIGQICDTNIHALILVIFCEVIARKLSHGFRHRRPRVDPLVVTTQPKNSTK